MGRCALRSRVVAFFVGLSFYVGAESARATLQWYYDPNTGNVSFDTSNTRSGELFIYGLNLNYYLDEYRFNIEEHISVTNSQFFESEIHHIADATLSNPVRGLYTIGNILPTGLSEETWTQLFAIYGSTFPNPWLYPEQNAARPGVHAYTDLIGGGTPPPAEFIYGAPEGEFNNYTDLIDPNTLAWAETAKLIYRSRTGEVFIDTTDESSGYTTYFLLKSEGEFLSENFTAGELAGPLVSASPDSVAIFADLIKPGRHALGRILEPGLSFREFEGKFSSAKFLGRAGFGDGSFDFETYGAGVEFALEAVPEPQAWAMVMTVAITILLRQRRYY